MKGSVLYETYCCFRGWESISVFCQKMYLSCSRCLYGMQKSLEDRKARTRETKGRVLYILDRGGESRAAGETQTKNGFVPETMNAHQRVVFVQSL